MSINRTEFARRQAEMTTRWFAGIKHGRTETEIEEYLARRRSAYVDRWNEALRFVPPAARVLDIGGGVLFPELLERFKTCDLEYWYLDADPDVTSGSRKLAEDFGFSGGHFSCGLNDELPYPDQHF